MRGRRSRPRPPRGAPPQGILHLGELRSLLRLAYSFAMHSWRSTPGRLSSARNFKELEARLAAATSDRRRQALEAQVFACRHSSVPVSRFIHSFCPRRHPSQLVAFKPAEARDKPWGNSRRRSAWPSAKAQIRYTTTTRRRRTPVHRSRLFWCMGGSGCDCAT